MCYSLVHIFLQTDPLPLSVPPGEGEWLEHTAQQAQKLFGMVKGGAENLFKNIKDTSSKMMHTVAGLVHLSVCLSDCLSVYLLFCWFLMLSFFFFTFVVQFYKPRAQDILVYNNSFKARCI